MAEKKAGGLYLSIGLTLSQLQSDFLAAEQTVKQGIAALNRQQNIVKLKMETDITGLDATADKTKILAIQERSLTQLLEMQRDKLKLATAAYQDVAQSKGANSTAAKALEASMERERLAVARLEAQLKSLSTQKISINTSQLQDNISKLNARIQHIKIQADIDTSKLKGASSAFDAQKIHVAAVTRELDLQRQKLAQLQAAMYQVAQSFGSGSVQSLNIKSNVLQQIQQINQLELKLKDLQSKNINLQIHADSMRQVEQSVTDSIARINARLENIRVKTDIDVSKLGAAASEFDKAKAHVQGLNRELDLQNQKLAEMKRALGNSISVNGLNNVKTINLHTDIQKQIQEIDRLKAKIEELNKIQPPKTNSLLSGYQGLKGNFSAKVNELSSAFTTLQGATSSTDAAITSVLGVIGRIPASAGLAVAGLVGIPLVFKGIENSILDLTRAAAASGDATYVMSRGFQMSIADTGKFSTNAKVAGAQVNDLAMAVKNVQRQVARGGEDSRAAEWLKKYGESAYDANGNLKNLNEMTFALNRALKQAQAEGKGAEFVLNVFRNVSADAITAIEDWADVNEQASTIVKAGLANPALAHAVKGNLNAMNVQSAQLGTSFTNALLPVANEIVPRITERMGRLTQVIKDNKDVIKEFGKDFAAFWGGIETVADKVGAGVGAVGSVLKEIYMARTNVRNQLVERYKDDADIKTAEDLLRKELSRSYLPTERAAIENSAYLYEQELRKYEPIIKGIRDSKEKIKEEKKSLANEIAQGVAGNIFKPLFDSFNQNITPELQKYRDEVDAILYKLNHTDYENKIYDIEKQYEAALRNGDKTLLEPELQKLKQAQLAQIQKEQADKIKEYWKNAADIEYSLTHTAFEKQIRDIEQWKEAQLQKASTAEEVQGIIANAAAKEAQAFEDAMDRIKGKLQSLDDKIFAQEHSQYEQDLRRIQQERIRYYEDFQKEGVLNPDTVARIERWYSNAVSDLNKKAAKGGDYTKAPEGAMQRGGNGIMVIGADQIIDDGKINQSIGLIADESRERALLSQGLSKEIQERIAAIDSAKQLNNAQKILAEQTQQAASGFQIIEGDKFSNLPTQAALPQADIQQISGDEVIPTQQLQQFGDAIQQTNSQLENFNPASAFADANKALAESAKALPPDYFKNLADGTKAVSEMQLRLTDSTVKLIDAQSKLAEVLKNLPDVKQTNNEQAQFKQMALTNQDIQDGQIVLDRKLRETGDRLANFSDFQQSRPVKQDSGFKFGIDYDTFKDVLLTGVGLAAPAALTGVGTAAIPAIAVGTLVTALTAAIAKGSYDETTAVDDYPDVDLSGLTAQLSGIDEKLQSVIQATQDKQSAETPEINFSDLMTPLNNLDIPLSSILQQMQDTQPQQQDRLQEFFGALPNIEADVKSVLLELQSRAELPDNSAELPNQSVIDYLTPLNNIDTKAQAILQEVQAQASRETTISFDTVVTPLNNIAGVVQNILTALSDRQPPNVTVSPSVDIDLGGAYVFDEAMKSSLVNDITSRVVNEIKNAVQQATSQSNYGYSA